MVIDRKYGVLSYLHTTMLHTTATFLTDEYATRWANQAVRVLDRQSRQSPPSIP